MEHSLLAEQQHVTQFSKEGMVQFVGWTPSSDLETIDKKLHMI